jgi:DivIVA domain-containing protein
MPLTPEDVSNKRFTPVRLAEGYKMAEVDAFLDEVEAELTRLNRENSELRGKLGTAPGGEPADVEQPAAEQRPTQPEQPQQPVAEQQPATTATAEASSERLTVSTAAEASSAATRLLEIATRNADELVGEARAEAEKIRTDARNESERLTTESRERVERLEADARTRSEMLDSETEERRQRLFGDLDLEKERLNGEIDNLRSFEREYRARLKSYFEQQLSALDGSGEGGFAPGERSGSLSSLLGEPTESS